MGTSSTDTMATQEEELLEGDSPLGESAFRERLRDLPPSAKLVARTLHENAPLATRDIAERSLLSARTVRNAVNRLEEADLVEFHPGIRDARTQLYILTSPAR